MKHNYKLGSLNKFIHNIQMYQPKTTCRYGGWEGEELVEIFAEYARICYQNFGDRVSQNKMNTNVTNG